ncbi:MAG: DNA photolyase family protein [Chloroflexales bacterium]|nr:DNA photolyase family protein [Chloroflexales bacterium]
MAPIIHWLRRDLRLHDNTALAAASHDSDGAVLPVFILDERLLTGRFASPARVRFMLESLQALERALRERGSTLLFRRGDPQQELLNLAKESSATAVYWNRDYSPFAIKRDSAIKQALGEAGVTARSFKDAVIWELDEILTKEGNPYTVYTPYARRWRQRLDAEGFQVHEAPDCQSIDTKLSSAAIPDLADLGMDTAQQVIPGGEAEGQCLLQEFTDLRRNHNITAYKTDRDMLALPGTSRLSAHLRLGTVSPRAALRAALDVAQHNDAEQGVQTWIGELAWRDFYVQILYHFPHVLRSAFRAQYDALEWENDENLFAAWCEGRTGYPVVDAAMRQLNQEAWMHNRARMIVASFLTKDLLIDWRWGERYFMQRLVDGDPAANNGGWQWAAGTGTDAQPYFRIFNPTSQGQKFDPDGAYVRRYVPELAQTPTKYIHEPWKMNKEQQRAGGVQIGHDYPAPIVDHTTQRQRALDMYGKVK